VIASACEFLSNASKPLIIVGGGGQGAATQLQQTAERLGAPVLASTNGKGALAEDHPLALGTGPQHPSAVKALADADAILAVGTELAPADWWLGLPDIHDKLVRIDIDASSINVNATPAY